MLSFKELPAAIVGLDMEDEVMELANSALLALCNQLGLFIGYPKGVFEGANSSE